MKKRLLLASIYLVLTLPVFAQKNFQPGYIVTLQNDTLKGLISYKGDTKNALECNFKTTENAEAQKYNPGQLKGYGFTSGKFYESYIVKVVKHQFNDVTMKFEEQAVVGQPSQNFLKILVKGTAALYYLVDIDSKPHFFLKNKDRELTELVVKEANITNVKTGGKYHQRLKIYSGTLLNEFSDCPNLKNQIEKTEFKESELVDLVVAYNHCKSPGQAILKSVRKKPVYSWNALGGISFSMLKIKANGHFLESDDYSSKPAITIGMALDYSLPSLNEKLSLNNALFYTRRNYTNNIDDHLETYYYNNYQVEYNFNYLRLESTLRYTIPTFKLKPFFQAGVANNLMLNGEEKIIKTRNFQNHPPENDSVEPVLPSVFRKYQLGIVAGSGLKLPLTGKRSLNLQLNYELNNGFTNTVGFNTKSHNFALLTGLSF